MKRSGVDIMFIDEAKKKRRVLLYSFLITIVSIFAILLALTSIKKGQTQYVKYKENSNIDYKVYLRENDFFRQKYLDKNSEYIASLIDYINADFNYNIALDEKGIDFTYTRRVDAIVEVYDQNGKKPLYKITEELLSDKSEKSNNKTSVNIAESVKIDYNHYNNLISEFKERYGLGNVNSTLIVRMHVSVKGDCNDLSETPDTETDISLNIPLTTKTMSIEMESDLVEGSDGLLVCKRSEPVIIWWIGTAFLIIIDIVLAASLFLFIVRNRTAKDIYKRELKRILNNYHSFIQKINNDFKLTGYQVLKVDTFTDMLEIRDTIQQPILMVESKQKNGVHFIIPSNTKILYTYSLKEEEIRKEMEM